MADGEFQIDPEKLIIKMRQQKEELIHQNTLLECLAEDQQKQIETLRNEVDEIGKKMKDKEEVSMLETRSA